MTAVLLVLACLVGVLGVGWACYGALMCQHGLHQSLPADRRQFVGTCKRCGEQFSLR